MQEIEFEEIDINSAPSSGIIKLPSGNKIAYSKWVSPKRTRSYPFQRIYDTFYFNGQKITIIPIIKDEGIKGDCDRINFITLSWMNLMGIYIILAWYEIADKNINKPNKITSQRFNQEHIKNRIEEIANLKVDAHHWNNYHFKRDFKLIYDQAVASYQNLEEKLGVKMHKAEYHNKNLAKFLNIDGYFDLESFKGTLNNSHQAAIRESKTIHKLESLLEKTTKPIIAITNNLGGQYFLTCDEVYLKNGKLNFQEAKNTSTSRLPSISDIKDGLFKLILFSQIEKVYLDDKIIDFTVSLRITGKVMSNIVLPTASDEEINSFTNSPNYETPKPLI